MACLIGFEPQRPAVQARSLALILATSLTVALFSVVTMLLSSSWRFTFWLTVVVSALLGVMLGLALSGYGVN
jgi:hypothetical protein